jgi:hypothetical protein
MVKYNFRRYGLKRKILFGILSLVLVLSLVIIPTGCPKRDTTTPTTDAERITALESRVSQLQSKIASLPESDSTDYSGDINALYDEIDNLSMELDDILVEVDDMLATWEEEQESSNGSSSSESEGDVVITRWAPSIEFDPVLDPLNYDVSVDWYPTRIKEADTYKFAIEVKAIGNQDKLAVNALWVSFNPTSRDTAIDTGNTGIYSVSPLRIWWDAEYSPSNGEDCRSIVFISDDFEIPALGDTETYIIKFDFDLYYAE